LMICLGIDPFAGNKQLWQRLIEPVHRDDLLAFLRVYMHRSTKASVEHELSLPQQHEHVYFLHFTPAEQHLYDMEVQAATTRISACEDEDDKRTAMTSSFKSLRESCSHIQVNARLREVLGDKLMSMEQVLQYMVSL
jgi:E3 ubiquitin-protein ligase SHPRH